MKSSYEKLIKLPSLGLIYDNVPESITIRAITTKEEKYIYSTKESRNFAITKLLNACIVPNEDGFKLDAGSLYAGDFLYVLMQLRILSYGGEYHQFAVCPFCNHAENIPVNLEDLSQIVISEEKFAKYSKVELGEDTLGVKLFSTKEVNALLERVEKIASKSKNADISILERQYLRAGAVSDINGEKVTLEKALKYFENSIIRNAAKFDSYQNNLGNTFGIEEFFDVTCSGCGQFFETPFTSHNEFFHPRFD